MIWSLCSLQALPSQSIQSNLKNNIELLHINHNLEIAYNRKNSQATSKSLHFTWSLMGGWIQRNPSSLANWGKVNRFDLSGVWKKKDCTVSLELIRQTFNKHNHPKSEDSVAS